MRGYDNVWNPLRERNARHPFTKCLMFLSGTGLLLALSTFPARAEEKSDSSPRAARAVLANLQEAFASVADEVEPCVVTLYSVKSARAATSDSKDKDEDILRRILPPGRSRSRRSTGTGSGVIIRPDGWILTNDHVVGGADKVTVKLHDGREFIGTVRRDIRSDLALVKISGPASFPTARLGDSSKLKVGHWAIAIGSPYRYEGSFSVGVISSLYRQQTITDLSAPGGQRLYPHMLQTDAAINPGNSGGPLVNLDGEVIAINTAIESEGGGSVGIGFAIPINAAKFVVEQLIEKGKVSYGYLGVSPTSVTPRLASALKVDQGALIEFEPEVNSPAAKAGLEVGDVVTAINMQPVRNELDLRTIIARTAPGTTVDLAIVRNGQKRVLKATLAEPREVPIEKPKPVVKSRLGIEVQPLTDKLAEQAGVPAKTQGVVIKTIDPDSNAADELREGVVILKVNDVETPTVQAFQSAIASLKSGDQVKILIQFEKSKKIVYVAID